MLVLPHCNRYRLQPKAALVENVAMREYCFANGRSILVFKPLAGRGEIAVRRRHGSGTSTATPVILLPTGRSGPGFSHPLIPFVSLR